MVKYTTNAEVAMRLLTPVRRAEAKHAIDKMMAEWAHAARKNVVARTASGLRILASFEGHSKDLVVSEIFTAPARAVD